MGDEITEKEAAEMLRQVSEGKQNMHSFFTKVIKNPSTTKTGNLDEDELGKSKLPLRTYLELNAFCEDIVNDTDWANYFEKIGEIQTASSLSKEGFLMKLAVTLKKELADVSPPKKTKKKNRWGNKAKGETEE